MATGEIKMPVVFEEQLSQKGNPQDGGPPYQIRAQDMDKNHVYAALNAKDKTVSGVANPFVIQERAVGKHNGRLLELNPLPTKNTTALFTFWRDKYTWVAARNGVPSKLVFDGARVTWQPEETTCYGLGLFVKGKLLAGGTDVSYEVWINVGQVAGQIPAGMNQSGMVMATGGSGVVWAEITVDQTKGQITSRAVKRGNSVPDDTDTKFHLGLGSYLYFNDGGKPRVSNYACGSVEAIVCRNWFAASSPFFGVTLSRCCNGGY